MADRKVHTDRTAAPTQTDLPRERVAEPARDGAHPRHDGETRREHAVDQSARRPHDQARDRFGGFSWGSIFFGWLVAVGLAAILTALLGGAGTAIGFTELSGDEARANAETIGLGGGILLLLVLLAAYFAGGYVAGRLARFDGARQGFGVWVLGLVLTALAAGLAAVAGAEWNVFARLDLPRIPIDEGTLTTAGAVALAAVVLGTVLAAVLGGRMGERFHRRVDDVEFGHAPAG